MESTNTTSSMSPEDIRAAVQARAVEAHMTIQQQIELSTTSSFKFVTASELTKEPKATDWLIRGYLEGRSSAYVYGEPGCMKTFLTLDMGLSVASGISWHGHSVKQGPVLFIIGEGHQGISKRVKAWCDSKNVDTDNLPFAVSSVAAQFLDPASAEAVTAAISEFAAKHGAPRLVVVDTMNRNFGPGDENSTKDMTAFVRQLDLLKERFGCAIVVTAHTGHGDKTRVRGSSALHGAADFAYRLTGTKGTRTLECEKAKDHELSSPLAFTPETVSTGWIDHESGQAITSCVLQRVDGAPGRVKGVSRAHSLALQALINACAKSGTGHALKENWRKEAYAMGISESTNSDTKLKAFNRSAEALFNRGDVQESSPGYYHPNADILELR